MDLLTTVFYNWVNLHPQFSYFPLGHLLTLFLLTLILLLTPTHQWHHFGLCWLLTLFLFSSLPHFLSPFILHRLPLPYSSSSSSQPYSSSLTHPSLTHPFTFSSPLVPAFLPPSSFGHFPVSLHDSLKKEQKKILGIYEELRRLEKAWQKWQSDGAYNGG